MDICYWTREQHLERNNQTRDSEELLSLLKCELHINLKPKETQERQK